MEPNNIIKLMNNISEESKNEKTENLIPILRQYNLNDLIRSIFCINSWIVNRSTINNCLALNNALTKINNFGNKNIKSY
ncbi:MAG: hypothetical protein Ta2C_03710 [Candidatus Endomicrobiellum trichonymphae]|nr:MAG: hypothetical protein Ta2C_03710 [Candidatus Endomicrobium trichonymphae]